MRPVLLVKAYWLLQLLGIPQSGHFNSKTINSAHSSKVSRSVPITSCYGPFNIEA
jgi:hypothetical protein